MKSGTSMGTLEASRRIGAGWTLDVVGRLFLSDDPEDPLHWFRRDDYLEATVEYYF